MLGYSRGTSTAVWQAIGPEPVARQAVGAKPGSGGQPRQPDASTRGCPHPFSVRSAVVQCGRTLALGLEDAAVAKWVT